MSGSEEVSKISGCGLSRNEVAELLQSVIELHNIEVMEDRIEFAGISPCVGIPEREESDGGKAVIPFADIAFITPFEGRVEVLLHSGELYTFSRTESVITHINTYADGTVAKPEKPTTPHDISENIWDGLEKNLAGR